jgi:hypothetical protein
MERAAEEWQMKVKDFDVSSAERVWQAFQRSIGVAAIHTPKEYERAVALTQEFLRKVAQHDSQLAMDMLRATRLSLRLRRLLLDEFDERSVEFFGMHERHAVAH